MDAQGGAANGGAQAHREVPKTSRAMLRNASSEWSAIARDVSPSDGRAPAGVCVMGPTEGSAM
jgi:hypothetical protein